MSQMLPCGAELAGYRIDELIGRGGMSEVYRAHNPRLGNTVALKLLPPELAEDDMFRERFVRESRLAAGLDHPNVLPIYDAGEADGRSYIAMRYVDGPDLGKVIAQGPLSVERVVSIAAQVAGALDSAHERGLLHRDVKPGNILIDDTGDGDHAYLADFGVAKHSESSSGLTRTGQFVGTIDYIAPEQIEGKPLDGRTDLYSLGCVVFEALTASSPFERDSNVAMIYAHLLDPPPSILEKRPDLTQAFDEAINRALAKLPDDRYPSCRAFVAALRAALTGSPVTSSPVGSPETALASSARSAGDATQPATADGSAPPSATLPPPLRSADGGEQRPFAVTPSALPTNPLRPPVRRLARRRLVLALAALLLALAAAAVAAKALRGSSRTVLVAPTALHALASASSVSLDWRPTGSDTINGYRVVRDGRSIATTAQTAYVDRTVRASTEYSYAVRALSRGRAGPSTARVVVRTQAGSIVIQDPPCAPNEVSVKVENRAARVRWKPGCNGGSRISGYVVTPYAGVHAQPSRKVRHATSTTVRHLVYGTTYRFRVKALNEVGSSAESVSKLVSVRAPSAKPRGGNTGRTTTSPRSAPPPTTTAPRPTTPTCVNHRRIIGYREGRPIYQTC